MNFVKLFKVILFLLAAVCFYVVFLMYSKLSFIDTPYLYGGVVLLITALLIRKKK